MRATSSLAPADASMFDRRSWPRGGAATEHVQRQIAVAVIVTVEEAAFLVAGKRIVGHIEIEDDLLGRRLMRLEEQVHEQTFDRNPNMPDLLVATSAAKARARAG